MGTSRNATPLVVSHYSSFSDFALAGNFWGLVLLSRLPPVSFYRQDSISCFPLPAQCLFTGTVVSPTLLSLVFGPLGLVLSLTPSIFGRAFLHERGLQPR